MTESLKPLRGMRLKTRRLPLDIDAGILFALFCAVFAAVVGYVRGVQPDILSGRAIAILVLEFAVAGGVVGSVVVGRPDFGPSKRAAAVRGFVAAIPLYSMGGLLFLPAERWFSVNPLLSLIAAAFVGPPIGVFVYRTYRRRDADDSPADRSVELAWLKGEMLGGWTPLLLSIAVLASLGVGIRALPERVTSPTRPPPPPTLSEIAEQMPNFREEVEADPTNVAALYRLGSAHFSFGQFDTATRILGEAAGLDSSRIPVWIALARASFYSGDRTLAARAYWNVLRVDPTALRADGLDRVLLDAALSDESWRDGVEP